MPQVQLQPFLADHLPMLHAYIVIALHAGAIPDVAQIPANLEVPIQHAPGLAAVVAQPSAAELSVPSFAVMAMQSAATADGMSANVPLLLGQNYPSSAHAVAPRLPAFHTGLQSAA